jgi:hypothetical protein
VFLMPKLQYITLINRTMAQHRIHRFRKNMSGSSAIPAMVLIMLIARISGWIRSQCQHSRQKRAHLPV